MNYNLLLRVTKSIFTNPLLKLQTHFPPGCPRVCLVLWIIHFVQCLHSAPWFSPHRKWLRVESNCKNPQSANKFSSTDIFTVEFLHFMEMWLWVEEIAAYDKKMGIILKQAKCNSCIMVLIYQLWLFSCNCNVPWQYFKISMLNCCFKLSTGFYFAFNNDSPRHNCHLSKPIN